MTNEINKYSEEFINDAFNFLKNYQYLGINIDEVLVLSKKENIALKKIIKQYRKLTLYKDASYESLTRFDSDEILKLGNSFLIEVFPNLKKEILNLDRIIIFENEDDGLYFHVREDGIDFEKITISDNFNEASISNLVHEKTHAISFNHLNTIELFKTGLELFPVFLEKMYTYEYLESNNSYLNIFNIIIRSNDIKKCAYFLEYASYLSNLEEISFLDKQVANYFRIRGLDYILADIYSNVLMREYISNRNLMIENINKVFTKKLSILEFLDTYNINLLSKGNIPIMKEELNKCKRKIFLP